MSKFLIAAASWRDCCLQSAPQPAQARHCSMVTATAQGPTQGIATTKAERRLQRYVANNLSGWGLRAGPRNSCQGWGAEGLRPSCHSAAVVCS